MSIQVVILAAGQGKRMNSGLPKVLHHLAGKPLLEHVVKTAVSISPKPIVVFGHDGEKIKQALQHGLQHDLHLVEQKEQLGTAHALMQTLSYLDDEKKVLILCGDVPLISQATLARFIHAVPDHAVGILTAEVSCPFGYGRVQRDTHQNIIGIVEEKDASCEEKTISEINTGIYLAPARSLKKWLPLIKNNNHQNEFYLTDIIKLAVQEKLAVHSTQPEFIEEILGVNDRMQLACLERFYQKQMAEKFMRQGVTICDPQRFDVRGNVKIGRDVVIDVNVILENDVVIGDECIIGANTILRNTRLGNRVTIKPHTLIEGANIASDCVIGPFARIRPDTQIDEQVHVGNFVEIKKSHIASETKINHLSYVGDSEIGKKVNIGAGTITCNYDGARKHQTIIGDNVFIGSDTQLIAPVVIGKGATIGAGSTITQDVPPDVLTLSRVPQHVVSGWQRPVKKEE